jgi:hypothetical protein
VPVAGTGAGGRTPDPAGLHCGCSNPPQEIRVAGKKKDKKDKKGK